MDEKIIKIVFTIILVILIIILLVGVYLLKEKHTIGLNIQKECGDMYFELDRGDYRAYQAYESYVKNMYISVFMILAVYGLLVILYLTTVIGNITKNNINFKDKKFYILVVSFLTILTLFILWLISLITYKDGSSKYKFTISPFRMLIPVWRVVLNQILMLVAILLIFGYLYYNEYIVENNLNSFINIAIISIIALLIILPIASAFINDFERVIKEYQTNIEFLNTNMSADIVKENNAVINFDTFKEFGIDYDITTSEKYKYALHTEDNTDINVYVPPELKPYILTPYLKGTLLMSFKKSLISYYNTKQTNKITDILNVNERKIIKEHFEDFLETEIITLLNKNQNDLTDPEKKKLEEFKEVLNNYVIINKEVLGKTNPVTMKVRDHLYKMRNNKNIENTLAKYFTIIKIFLYGLLIVILYYIYKEVMTKIDKNIAFKIWSVMIMIILIVGFIAAFLSKEFWL